MLGNILTVLSPMALLWLVLLLIFAVTEALTVGLVSIWFAVGAMVALIAAGLNAPVWLQVVLFLAVSAVMLALLRPIARRMSGSVKQTRTNADRHIGQTALVTEEIDNLKQTGAVRLDGVEWSARSENGQVLPVGSTITVRRITGAKIWVEPASESASEPANV